MSDTTTINPLYFCTDVSSYHVRCHFPIRYLDGPDLVSRVTTAKLRGEPRQLPVPRLRQLRCYLGPPTPLWPIQNGKNMARSAMFFPWRAGRHPPPPGPKARRAGGPAEAGALIAGSRPITITCKSHVANFQCIQGHDKYLGAHFAWGAHFCLGLLHRGPYRYFSPLDKTFKTT